MRNILQFILTLVVITQALLFGGTTGKLTGKVTDAKTDEALPFVNIILVGTNLGAATDIDGNYVILNIPPGAYEVKAQYIGYQAVVVSNVRVSIDQTTTVDFELNETAVEIEEVVVEAKKDYVQKDVTSSQSLISSDQIEVLPVTELDDVLQLQAGVTKDADGNFHIRGGRTTEIAYWVNGISITDGYDNSRGIQIDNNSVQELQVISGTFNAEYGNAMSGVINTVTKEGGMYYHGSILLYTGDHVSNFTEYFPHIDDVDAFSNYNLQGSLGGPIPFTNNIVSFFFNGRYYYDDGYLYGERRYNPNGTSGDNSVVPMNWRKNYYGQGNISFLIFQDLKFNLEGLYSKEDYQDYNHEYRWNPDGEVNKFAESFNTTATINHMLSSSTFYTLKGSFFRKDFNEYLYSNPFDSRYQHPDSSVRFDQYTFRDKGTNLHRFNRQTKTFLGKLDFTSQVSQTNLLKIGTEVKTHNLKFDDYYLEPLRINNIEVEPYQPSIPDISQTNRDKYATEPFEASAYIQDKIEFENVIINIGVRLDYFDAKGKLLFDESEGVVSPLNGERINSFKDPNIYAPIHSPSYFGLNLPDDKWTVEYLNQYHSYLEPYFYTDSKAKYQVSPRFGIAYPISAAGVVHFSYGHFLQIPTFQYLYQKGLYKVPNSGQFIGPFGNPDLEAQKTVMYEIGFRQEFLNDYVIDVTGFYRDVRDWITAGPILYTTNLVSYSIFINKDYANVKGITLTLSKRFTNYFAFDVNYTYQVAEGSNSKPEDTFDDAKGNNEPSLFLIPMDWDQNHLLNASLVFGFDNWGISLLSRYGTGLPYDPIITQYTALRNNLSSGFLDNSRRKPSQFTIDLKVDKTFLLAGLDITAFLKVFNLLDNKVAVNVFGDTGQPDFTTEIQTVSESAERGNTVKEYVKYPTYYGEPRNIQFGIELSF